MKFGKHIQRRQLEIPEYSAAFVNYKALKKLIKQLSATPVLAPQHDPQSQPLVRTNSLDPQKSLQANKGAFFFKVDRELEKVNVCYLQKEAELRLRLKLLTDKKTMVQASSSTGSRQSASLRSLLQGFEQFNDDLSKLQQYIEVNATAFSKILKKWDKTSKSKTKELYLSRAVEVQPFFNQEVLRQLSDQATTDRLELEAWAEGERLLFNTATDASHGHGMNNVGGSSTTGEDSDTDNQILNASKTGEMGSLRGWITRLKHSPEAGARLTRAFLFSVADAPVEALKLFVGSNQVDINAEDEISGRNCLHEATIAGRHDVLEIALKAGVDPSRTDVYGRIPLHYACMRSRVAVVVLLLRAAPTTIDTVDHGKFTPLIHSIVHNRLDCAQHLLAAGARLEPQDENDHIPLNLACQHGAKEIAQLLLQRKAQILADAEGLYPQHLVARSGKHSDLLLTLEANGADLDQRDKLYQWTPLFHAASEGCVSTLEVLLQKGVDVDVQDEKDLPAMYYAAWEGHLECMQLLARAHAAKIRALGANQTTPVIQRLAPPQEAAANSLPGPMSLEGDGIPDLELPPPIIPLRKYGHSFLDSKAFIQITFDPPSSERHADAVMFYHDNKYPAARLTISSKSSDLIPRNIGLPLQDEDSRRMSFQVENIDNFTLEFDIYPTFGAKRIAHGVALPDVFSARESSKGRDVVPLFDSRLRVIGRIEFRYQVIKPCTFPGAPVDLAMAGPLETYWKSTTQDSQQPDSLVTGSSLNGDYVQLSVQLTKDAVPVLAPYWALRDLKFPIKPVVSAVTLKEFKSLADGSVDSLTSVLAANPRSPDLVAVHKASNLGHLTLAETLDMLPQSVHVALNILYPSPAEEKELGFGPALNINDFADAVLRVVFDHARRTKGGDRAGYVRSFVFKSWNPDVCTALNWKQPNYPVLLCNDLGSEDFSVQSDKSAGTQATDAATNPSTSELLGDGRASLSIKEAVRIAQSNNFMGLVCSSRLLKSVPALRQAIKVAGLVLVSDTSFDAEYNGSRSFAMPNGIDGLIKSNGVLRFNDTVDMS